MLVATTSAPAGAVRRARVIPRSAAGETGVEIATRLDVTAEAVSRIRRRFREEGVAGLADRPKTGRTDNRFPSETVEHIVQLAMSPPPPGRTRWTTRLLGKAVGRGSKCISKLLRNNGLKPHLVKQSLSATSFPSKKALRNHIAAHMRDWKRNPTPLSWTKPAAAIIKSRKPMLARISAAVH